MIKKECIKCPICEGAGTLKKPKLNVSEIELKENATIILKKAGFSYREIMRLVGYKSPRSIQNILKKQK